MNKIVEGTEEATAIASILAGDTAQYHDLIRPYEQRVYAMALSMMKNDADAEDVAQEAFLLAYRNLAGFRGEASFSTWLISITLNEARARLRRGNLMPTESLDDTLEHGGHVSPALLLDWREIPSEMLERGEVRDMLQHAISSLPFIYREIFLLRDVEGLSVNEASVALEISIPTVKTRLHRARMLLQRRLVPLLRNVNPKRRWRPWS